MMYTSMYVYPYLSLFIYISTYLSIKLSIYLSIFLSFYPSIYLFVYLYINFIHSFIHSFIHCMHCMHVRLKQNTFIYTRIDTQKYVLGNMAALQFNRIVPAVQSYQNLDSTNMSEGETLCGLVHRLYVWTPCVLMGVDFTYICKTFPERSHSQNTI